MANEPKKVRQRRSMLQIPGVQTILSSLLCIVLGLLVGFVVLLLIDHGVSEKTGNLNAIDAILVIIKNFWKYGSSTAQMKYLGNTLVKTAPLLMCGLSVLFAYKVGLFNIGAAGQYVVGAGAALYCALAWNMPWYVCLLAAALAGALLACISGALKAFCNVNEVISCILLNWISLYAVNSLLSLVKDSNTPYTVKLSVGNPSALMPSLGLEKLFSNNRYVTIAIPLLRLRDSRPPRGRLGCRPALRNQRLRGRRAALLLPRNRDRKRRTAVVMLAKWKTNALPG